MATYEKEIQIQHKTKLHEIISKLPPYCKAYFQAIESAKAIRTRVAYARNIYSFFEYIICKNPLYNSYEICDLPLELLSELTPEDIDEYMSYLRYHNENGQQYENAEITVARKISALSSMYGFFNKRKIVINNPFISIERPKIPDRAIIALNEEQIIDLMNAVDKTENMSNRQKNLQNKIAERDRAILSVFLGTGIRVSELVGLDLSSIDFKEKTIKVFRKGGKEEYVYFSEEVLDALLSYLNTEDEDNNEIINVSPRERLLGNNEDDGALFLSIRGTRITVRSVENLVKKYSSQINTNKKITPHKLRSTYGTQLYKETGDIYLVADVLGHNDVNTTKRHYSAIGDERKRLAASVIKLK